MTVRTIEVRERVLARNDEIAAQVRAAFAAHHVCCLNLVSAPGSGKTTLLERTLARVGASLQIAIIAGDVQTQNDADRLDQYTDRLVHAVVTGGACHLDARQVLAALEQIDLAHTDLVLVENVGNLVCPASWDLGENAKVVLFSVTEGEDKPLKYPKMFREAAYVVFTKTDLLPYLTFSTDRALEFARDVNPHLDFYWTSALSGAGLDEWCALLYRLTGAPAPA